MVLVIDLPKLMVIPGLIDVHTHLSYEIGQLAV
jgi:imidazolonepropionase-like amidohydrolase